MQARQSQQVGGSRSPLSQRRAYTHTPATLAAEQASSSGQSVLGAPYAEQQQLQQQLADMQSKLHGDVEKQEQQQTGASFDA